MVVPLPDVREPRRMVCRGKWKGNLMQTTVNGLILKGKLVNGQQLLDDLFDPEAKPSMRWLRTQTKAKAIPFFRVGHLVFFDVEMVKASLAGRNLVAHRMRSATVSPTV